MGSGSSITLYSALSKAAKIYSANIIKERLEILRDISCAVHPIVSIGPRLFSHGDIVGLCVVVSLLLGFNWATTFQSWRHS